MVSKLLLATQELYFKAIQMNENTDTIRDLGNLYYKLDLDLVQIKRQSNTAPFHMTLTLIRPIKEAPSSRE